MTYPLHLPVRWAKTQQNYSWSKQVSLPVLIKVRYFLFLPTSQGREVDS